MEFIEYYKSEKSRIINELTLDKIKKEKQGLLVAIEDKNINSKHIVKIKKIISKRGIEGKLSSIISKILEEDNIFANLFYPKPALTTPHSSSILLNYISIKGVELVNNTPSKNPTKYSLPYLGSLDGVEVYYYLVDGNKPTSHNEVVQRVNVIENNVEYSQSIIILDDVISGGKMETSFPSVFKLNNVVNIKSFLNE